MSLLLGLYGMGTLVGLGLLWWGGDLVVRYSVAVARALRITTFFFGFIIMALAATVPELAMAITAGLRGIGQASAGNIIGANFCDVALIVGVTLLLARGGITLPASDRRHILRLLALCGLVMLLACICSPLGFWHGVALIVLYVIIIAWLWKTREGHEAIEEEVHMIEEQAVAEDPLLRRTRTWILMLQLTCSVGLVMLASLLTGYCAEQICTLLQLPLEKLGATVLAFGTSLPELSMSLNALRRKEYNLAVGPTLGTVFEQATFILGILLVCSPTPISLGNLYGELCFMAAAFGIVGGALLYSKKLSQLTGALLFGLFLVYNMWQYAMQYGA